MRAEFDKVYFAGGRFSPAGKLVSIVVASVMLLSAIVLAFLFVGFILPLIIIVFSVVWALRRWRLRNAPLAGQQTRSAGEIMEGEFRVIDQPGKKESR